MNAELAESVLILSVGLHRVVSLSWRDCYAGIMGLAIGVNYFVQSRQLSGPTSESTVCRGAVAVSEIAVAVELHVH